MNLFRRQRNPEHPSPEAFYSSQLSQGDEDYIKVYNKINKLLKKMKRLKEKYKRLKSIGRTNLKSIDELLGDILEDLKDEKIQIIINSLIQIARNDTEIAEENIRNNIQQEIELIDPYKIKEEKLLTYSYIIYTIEQDKIESCQNLITIIKETHLLTSTHYQKLSRQHPVEKVRETDKLIEYTSCLIDGLALIIGNTKDKIEATSYRYITSSYILGGSAISSSLKKAKNTA